jgi:CubicO group peptidase (beta-lactamase class C family)
MKRWLMALSIAVIPAAGGHSAAVLSDNPRIREALTLAEVWLDAEMAYEAIPGLSAAIVHDQQLVWARGFGYADVARKTPARPDTLYSVCSISKLFTSIAVMQLRDEGKLELDEPIGKYLPWFNIKQVYPESQPVTLDAILTHSAGLPREADFAYWTGPEHRFPTHEEIVEHVAQQEMLYPASRHSQYSNLGLTLAGEVVAAVSGKPYAAYVQERILTPLGLASTTPELPQGGALGQRMATGYSALSREHKRTPVPFYQVRGIAPAAGFASTVEDLARFASWQLRLLSNGGREVVSAETLREMQRPQWIEDDWQAARGLGFALTRRNSKTFVGHGGNCPGFLTQLWVSPKDKIAVIVFVNAQGLSPNTYSQTLYDIVAPAIAKASGEAATAKPVDPALEKYTGMYPQPLAGERHVLIFDGELVVMSLPSQNPVRGLMKLKPESANVFRRVRDDGGLAERVVFELGPDGQVVRMVHNNNFSYRVQKPPAR